MLRKVTFDLAGMKGLPSTIDVEKFAEVPDFLLILSAWCLTLLRDQARSFEINAMQNALENVR
jgi:hypothetical protein